MAFVFNPVTGLLDTSIYPTTPGSEAAARQQFMDLFNQIRDEINNPSASGLWNNSNSPSSLSTQGYQKLPNGYIQQWANAFITTQGDIIFPVTFVLACFGVVASVDNGGVTATPFGRTLSKVSIVLSGGTSGNVTILAIGK